MTSYGHWNVQLKRAMPTYCPSRAILLDPFRACPECHDLRNSAEDTCMNAMVWTCVSLMLWNCGVIGVWCETFAPPDDTGTV